MSDSRTVIDRRDFLKGTGAVSAAGLAGCTSDSENSGNNTDSTDNSTTTNKNTPTKIETGNDTTEEENTPEEDRVTFEELYSEAERKPITGETLSQNTGPFDLEEVESMLSSNNSEAENVAIAATQASQHTREREDTPETIRYALGELDLNAFAQERRTGAGAKTDIYVEDGSSVKKVAVTKVPHNTDIPLQYSLIGGEEPGTGDGAKADNNLAKDWNENQFTGLSYLDIRTIKNVQDSGREINWENIADFVKNSYLLDGGVEESDIDFTLEAGLQMGELEDIDNDYHDEAFKAYKDANEIYHNEVVPEDKHLLVELNDSGLHSRAVDEETLMEEGYLHSHI
ncbi:twin-arginine translocation signal domain-containing protein [Halorussus amylolyticus]|uniref:twin-arginine translocation signal domain-containing protein n=1 Tax=Halorussus amylolyticus TaxID=1126242 RepID=UPI00192F1398|nr:twin-arginine translocation signal domain-containing protein [Halorussus amylolyticus]